jgi:hypothetical protein
MSAEVEAHEDPGVQLRWQKQHSQGLPTKTPAWKNIHSWFVISDQDLNIPVAAHRFPAKRAGSRGTREVEGGSHALSVSRPGAVAASILDAISR